MSTALDPLSDRGERMVESLAPYEWDDSSVVAVMRAGADELDAIEVQVEAVRLHAWPHLADDTYGLLSLHERLLGLPVAAPGATLAQRQAAVKAAVQARKSGRKADWVTRMDTAMRGQAWNYEENTPGPNQLTISISWSADSFNAQQVKALARRITPAHVDIIMAYEQGFPVGIGTVGEAL